MVSIIIPTYNEEKILLSNSCHFKELSGYAELIFCDGESTDRTAKIASEYGNLIKSKKGRARQMNEGAAAAKGDILLFLHSDATISLNTLKSIIQSLNNNKYIGGCLSQRIASDKPAYRLIEAFGNLRAKITNIFYGDQAIFVRKNIFLKLNGFPDVPIMEDAIFSRILRKTGSLIALSDKVFVSPRRWEKYGILNTVFLYSFLNILFWAHAPLSRIKQFYSDPR